MPFIFFYSVKNQKCIFLIFTTVTFKKATNETITQTSVTCEADNDIVAVLGFFGFLGRFVPFIVNIIMNLILIMGVIKSKKNVNRENRISTKDKTFTYFLILLNAHYLSTLHNYFKITLWGKKENEIFINLINKKTKLNDSLILMWNNCESKQKSRKSKKTKF